MRSDVARPTSLHQSVELFRRFRREQSDPDYFYRLLAADSVRQLAGYLDLPGRTVLDVGGGAGYFATAFRAAGCGYFGVDPDVGKLTTTGASTCNSGVYVERNYFESVPKPVVAQTGSSPPAT